MVYVQIAGGTVCLTDTNPMAVPARRGENEQGRTGRNTEGEAVGGIRAVEEVSTMNVSPSASRPTAVVGGARQPAEALNMAARLLLPSLGMLLMAIGQAYLVAAAVAIGPDKDAKLAAEIVDHADHYGSDFQRLRQLAVSSAAVASCALAVKGSHPLWMCRGGLAVWRLGCTPNRSLPKPCRPARESTLCHTRSELTIERP